MPISGIQLQIDTDVLDAVAYTANNAPGLMATAYKRQIRSLRGRLLQRLRLIPQNVPDLPFIWSYDPAAQARARRWYFANKVPKGSKGGRYQRTGAMAEAWDVLADATDYSGILAIDNPAKGAEYVYGPKQVPSHYATGWENVDDVISEFQEQATDEVIEIWGTIVAPEVS